MGIVKTVLSVLLILAIPNFCDAKEWSGITPLRSTLADVVRQFGPCATREKESCTYVWKNEVVRFVFLPESCGTGKQKLKRQTIVRIERRPNIATRLPDYHAIDYYHYIAFRSLDREGVLETYVNDDEGFAAESKDEVVTEVYYTASAEKISLCPGSYIRPSDLLPRYKHTVVWEFFGPHASVSCPNMTVEADQPITFSAAWSGGFRYLEPTYSWTLSAGTIIAGQGTTTIRVATKGLAFDSEITATFKLRGGPVEWDSTASCTTKIHPYRVRKQDQLW